MSAYDFTKVNLVITDSSGNQTYVTGFASGSTIDAAHKSDNYTPHTGVKGDTTYAKNNDNTGTIKFKIKSDSPTNSTLGALASSGDIFDASIIDGNDVGNSQASSSDCVMQKVADYSRGAAIAGVDWTIGCPNLNINYN